MMINTEELKKAVRSFNEYSPSQRTILELFIDIAIDNVVHVSAKYIADKTKIKTSTIYFAINLFLKLSYKNIIISEWSGTFIEIYNNRTRLAQFSYIASRFLVNSFDVSILSDIFGITKYESKILILMFLYQNLLLGMLEKTN